jgi:hypothetical protein
MLPVNEWTGTDEPTLADVATEFPGWECWRGTSGRYYGRRCGRPREHRAHVDGEDPRDLRDSILRWIGNHEAEDGGS